MGVDLQTLKRRFVSIMGDVSTGVTAQFIVWLDEKVSEFKVQGAMKLDTSPDAPKWIRNYSVSVFMSALSPKDTANLNLAGGLRPPNPGGQPPQPPRMQNMQRPIRPIMPSPMRKRPGETMPGRGMPMVQRPRLSSPSSSNSPSNASKNNSEDDCIMILEPETNTSDREFISQQLNVSQPPGARMASPVRPVGPPRMASPRGGMSPHMMTRPRRGRPPLVNFMGTNTPRMPRMNTPPTTPTSAAPVTVPTSTPDIDTTQPKTPPASITTTSNISAAPTATSAGSSTQPDQSTPQSSRPDSTNSSVASTDSSSAGPMNDHISNVVANIKTEKKPVVNLKSIKREAKDCDTPQVRSATKPMRITKREPDDPSISKAPTSTTAKLGEVYSDRAQERVPNPNLGQISFGHPFPSILSVESLATDPDPITPSLQEMIEETKRDMDKKLKKDDMKNLQLTAVDASSLEPGPLARPLHMRIEELKDDHI